MRASFGCISEFKPSACGTSATFQNFGSYSCPLPQQTSAKMSMLARASARPAPIRVPARARRVAARAGQINADIKKDEAKVVNTVNVGKGGDIQKVRLDHDVRSVVIMIRCRRNSAQCAVGDVREGRLCQLKGSGALVMHGTRGLALVYAQCTVYRVCSTE